VVHEVQVRGHSFDRTRVIVEGPTIEDVANVADKLRHIDDVRRLFFDDPFDIEWAIKFLGLNTIEAAFFRDKHKD